MVDMLRCSSGQCMLNGGYTCVQWWSMVDMLICSSGQWCIYSCAVVVNGGDANVQ